VIGMNILRNEKGFTLIELVMIIIILGILAAVAIPKFMNLRDDADRANAKSVVGALNSTASIVFAKHAVGSTGVCSEGATVDTAAELAACLDGGLPANWATSSDNITYTTNGTKHTFAMTDEVASTSRPSVATDDTEAGTWP
jgi:MSHA pilin protein MshA